MNPMNEFVKSKMQKIAKKVDEELPNIIKEISRYKEEKEKKDDNTKA